MVSGTESKNNKKFYIGDKYFSKGDYDYIFDIEDENN